MYAYYMTARGVYPPHFKDRTLPLISKKLAIKLGSSDSLFSAPRIIVSANNGNKEKEEEQEEKGRRMMKKDLSFTNFCWNIPLSKSFSIEFGIDFGVGKMLGHPRSSLRYLSQILNLKK